MVFQIPLDSGQGGPKIFQEAWAQQLRGTDESHRRSGGKRFQALAEAAGKDVLEGGQDSVGKC